MRILLKLALLVFSLIGLSYGSAPVSFNNGLTGSKKIILKSSNFGFCNVGTVGTDQVFNIDFDKAFSQVTFNISLYYDTKVDPIVSLNYTLSDNLKFDTIIESVIYQSINEVGYMYSPNSNKQCGVALANYMCSVAFPKSDDTVTEKPCKTLCENIESKCENKNFIFDYINSFEQVFPNKTECDSMGSTDCSESGNTLDNWEDGQTQEAVLFYLYPEDYPTCSFPTSKAESYRYLYPQDLLPTKFEILKNYTVDPSKNNALVSNLNNIGSTCTNCGNCTLKEKKCDYCDKCAQLNYGTRGDNCTDCKKVSDGISCSSCSGSRGSFALDATIKDVIFAGINKNGFEYQENATYDCVEILLTYLCTYSFRERGKEPCNSVCSAVYAPNYKCPTSFIYEFGGIGEIEILPNVTQCEARGAPDNENCSAISFLKVSNPFGWRYLYGTDTDFELRPGGAARGSVLGFGVLLGLLLVILSLGIVMKKQGK